MPTPVDKVGRDFLELVEKHGLAVLLLVVIVVFSILRPETFPTSANWRSIATTQAVPLVLAIALLPPLICGRFDISTGTNMACCSIVAAAVMSKAGAPLIVAILAAIGFGALVGFVNGFFVAYLGVNSLVGTLATGTILAALAEAYTDAIPISSGLSPLLTNLTVHRLAGIPVVLLIALATCAAAWFVLNQTPYGRRLAAIGVNLEAARLTGMRVKRLVLSSFVLGGGIAGIAGLLLVAQSGSGNPAAASISSVIPSFAAAFLGATTWQPGRYNVPGTIIALFFIGSVTAGLAFVGTQPWVTSFFNGAAVLFAVVIGGQIRRRRTGALEVGS